MKKILSITIVVLVVGCVLQFLRANSRSESLIGRWVPTYLHEQNDASSPEKSSEFGGVFIQFFSDGKITGMSGSNIFNGRYSTNGKSIKFSEMLSTRRSTPFDAYEQKFLSALSKAKKFDFRNSELVISDDSTELLKFKNDK